MRFSKLLTLALSLAFVGIGCKKQAVTVERHEEVKDASKLNLEGVWRSLSSNMAFRVLPDGKADFFAGQGEEIFSANYSNSGGRLRMEIAAPMMRVVENFVVRDAYLEHEGTGANYYREDAFLKTWLGARFADFSAVAVPTPGEEFFIRSEQKVFFQPEENTFGADYLEQLKTMVRDQIVLQSLAPKGKNNWKSAEAYECALNSEAASLPKAQNLRRGLIGIQWGSYSVQTIKAIDPSATNPDVKIITGIYTFRPNSLGERLMAKNKETIRSEYKFRAAVQTPRTIAKQPWLNAWDWGYANEQKYATNNVQ